MTKPQAAGLSNLHWHKGTFVVTGQSDAKRHLEPPRADVSLTSLHIIAYQIEMIYIRDEPFQTERTPS
jgi:hypothetical protein